MDVARDDRRPLDTARVARATDLHLTHTGPTQCMAMVQAVVDAEPDLLLVDGGAAVALSVEPALTWLAAYGSTRSGYVILQRRLLHAARLQGPHDGAHCSTKSPCDGPD